MMNKRFLGVAIQVVIMGIIISVVLLFVALGFLILLHVCIIGRASRREDRGTVVERDSRSMSKDEVEKLPCYHYAAKENGSSPVNCAVCLESLSTGDKCRLLPMCNHSFHAQCVDTWLLKTPICPICRSSAGSHRGSSLMNRNGHFSEPNSEELRESLESGSSSNVRMQSED